MRITIGARDLAEGKCEIARRDTMNKELVDIATVTELVKPTLDDIQSNLYNRALQYRLDNTRKADTWEEFVDILEHKGGFISAHWDGTAETEEKSKNSPRRQYVAYHLTTKKKKADAYIAENLHRKE